MDSSEECRDAMAAATPAGRHSLTANRRGFAGWVLHLSLFNVTTSHRAVLHASCNAKPLLRSIDGCETRLML